MKQWALCALALVTILVGGCFGPVVPPIAGFTSCPDGWQGQLDVQFMSTSTTIGNHWIVFHSWDFGDDETADDYSGWVTHHYAKEGAYTIRLEVTDDRGLKATSERTIEVRNPVLIENVTLSGYPTRAEGELRNQSGVFLYSVTVKVRFYDANDVRIGEGRAELNGVDPGERVRFTVAGPTYPNVATSVRATILGYSADCGGSPPPIPLNL
jgi:PKD repeat protein